MSQTVTFYKTSSDPKQVNKVISAVKENSSVTYYLTRPCNVINPVITTSYDSDFASANYCYIDSPFNRYYYIKNVNLIPGGKMEIICEVDPLKSWKGDNDNPGFLQSNATIIRAENPKTTQLHDSKYPLTSKKKITSAFFYDTPFTVTDGWNYVLYVMGQEGTQHTPTGTSDGTTTTTTTGGG